MENHSSVTGWQELFSHTNPSKFRWLLQSLPLRYTAENLQVWTIFLEKMETDIYSMQRFIVGTTPALIRGRKEINSSFPPRR